VDPGSFFRTNAMTKINRSTDSSWILFYKSDLALFWLSVSQKLSRHLLVAEVS